MDDNNLSLKDLITFQSLDEVMDKSPEPIPEPPEWIKPRLRKPNLEFKPVVIKKGQSYNNNNDSETFWNKQQEEKQFFIDQFEFYDEGPIFRRKIRTNVRKELNKRENYSRYLKNLRKRFG